MRSVKQANDLQNAAVSCDSLENSLPGIIIRGDDKNGALSSELYWVLWNAEGQSAGDVLRPDGSLSSRRVGDIRQAMCADSISLTDVENQGCA